MSMSWGTVTDENGNDFHALSDNWSAESIEAWVFFDKESGFGNDVGEVTLKKGLKRLPSGKYGA